MKKIVLASMFCLFMFPGALWAGRYWQTTSTEATANVPIKGNEGIHTTTISANTFSCTGSDPTLIIETTGTAIRFIVDDTTVGEIFPSTAVFHFLNYDSWDGPWMVEGTTVTYSTTTLNQPYNGMATYSDSVSTTTNYSICKWRIRNNFDITAAMTLKSFSDYLFDTDTSSRTYILMISSATPSKGLAGVTWQYPITVTIPDDASGAAGDLEAVTDIALTDWNSYITPGILHYIFIGRAGDSVILDPSTTKSYAPQFTIEYGIY